MSCKYNNCKICGYKSECEIYKENAELKKKCYKKAVKDYCELEKENERLTVSYETLKLHDEEEIGMLKSENIELKDDNKVMADNYSKMEQKFYNNFTKAKEHIRTLMSCLIDYIVPIDKDYCHIAEAEQFLKDNEVEK